MVVSQSVSQSNEKNGEFIIIIIIIITFNDFLLYPSDLILKREAEEGKG